MVPLRLSLLVIYFQFKRLPFLVTQCISVDKGQLYCCKKNFGLTLFSKRGRNEQPHSVTYYFLFTV